MTDLPTPPARTKTEHELYTQARMSFVRHWRSTPYDATDTVKGFMWGVWLRAFLEGSTAAGELMKNRLDEVDDIRDKTDLGTD